jgi:hypothetical protein
MLEQFDWLLKPSGVWRVKLRTKKEPHLCGMRFLNEKVEAGFLAELVGGPIRTGEKL